MRQQDRQVQVGENPLGCAAQHKIAEAGVAEASHREELCTLGNRGLLQGLRY